MTRAAISADSRPPSKWSLERTTAAPWAAWPELKLKIGSLAWRAAVTMVGNAARCRRTLNLPYHRPTRYYFSEVKGHYCPGTW
jgi:hypothetical protein